MAKQRVRNCWLPLTRRQWGKFQAPIDITVWFTAVLHTCYTSSLLPANLTGAKSWRLRCSVHAACCLSFCIQLLQQSEGKHSTLIPALYDRAQQSTKV